MKAQEVRRESTIIKQFDVEAEPVADRTVRFVVTTSNPDRERDTVDAAGIEVEAFLKNPVVMFGHDYRSLPIGRVRRIEPGRDRMVAVIEFASEELNPMAEQVFRMVTAGFLNATSIGFRPLEWTFNEQRGGVDFHRVELLEVSVVPVPANADALVAAAKRGLDVSLLKDWARGILAEEGGMRNDEVAIVFNDDADEERLDIDPEMVAGAVRSALDGLIGYEAYRKVCELRGRIPDEPAEWAAKNLPPTRPQSASSAPRAIDFGTLAKRGPSLREWAEAEDRREAEQAAERDREARARAEARRHGEIRLGWNSLGTDLEVIPPLSPPGSIRR